MRSKRIVKLCLGLLCGVAVAAFAQKVLPAPVLSPGRDYQGSLAWDGEPDEFSIQVPAEVFALRISVSKAEADLDLLLLDGGEEITRSESDQFNEVLFISRITDPPLEGEALTLQVAYQLTSPPVVRGVRQQNIPYTLKLEAVIPAQTAASFSQAMPGAVSPATGMVQVFRLKVPAGTGQIRADLYNCQADLDMFLSKDAPVWQREDAAAWADSLSSREVLLYDPDGQLEPGDWYLTVLNQVDIEEEAAFTLHLSTQAAAPGFLRALPRLQPGTAALERLALATVELTSDAGAGSGCIISERGYIITNFHVIEAGDGQPAPRIVVGMNIDVSVPPEELFEAEVVEYSRELDLALLRIAKTFYGDPVPQDYRFPAFKLGDSASLRFGDPLWFFGYPGIGGSGSRASITLTGGITAGFEKTKAGTVIKTDAEINHGNSGGAAMNGRYELIGLPTFTISQESGQLGFIHPVSLVPRAWWVKAGIAAGAPQ